MLQYIIFLYRTERSQSHMQCHIGFIYAFLFQLFQHVFCKVQSSCRSRRRTKFLGINCLIAFFVFQLFVNIRRKRHLSHFFQCSIKVTLTGKLHNSIAVRFHFNDFTNQSATAKWELYTDFCFFSGTADDFPKLIPFLFQQQEFDKGAIIYFLSVQTCRKNAGIIHYQQITRLQNL